MLCAFGSLGSKRSKSALVANQTLEPTQVAGFNQLFDEYNGTKAQRMGIGGDARIANNVYGGVELSKRHLEVPTSSSNFAQKRFETATTRYFIAPTSTGSSQKVGC